MTGLMSGLQLQRLGMIIEPEAGNPREIEGVLNPAAARGPDGELYLFPRLVAKGNFSRIGIARVRFNAAGNPTGVERLGIALKPEAEYELRPEGGGGCEDPRITFVEPLKRYVMTYTAFSPRRPRIALATSADLFHWQRLGLAKFGNYQGIELDDVDNKDASLSPVVIPNPSGHPELALLHQPLFPDTRPEETICQRANRQVDLDRESIWISYCCLALDCEEVDRMGTFTSHHRLATPAAAWERLKIGGGCPPILTEQGWLIIYHGVGETSSQRNGVYQLCYSAGLVLLSKEHPQVIHYRSREPVLRPHLTQEKVGTVADVVFPSGIDQRNDSTCPDRFDVYYGMVDKRIGVARLDLPNLPSPVHEEAIHEAVNR